MRNLLITGSGRSGTSMTAALFRDSGAWMGESSHAPRAANRFGFFEDAEINGINDRILRHMLMRRGRRWLWRFAAPIHRHPHALWLAAPRRVVAVRPAPDVLEAMRKHVSREPFCLKDPRFALTWPTWRRHLPAGTRVLVVFRDPDTTVDSMLREAHEVGLPLHADWAYRSWIRLYRRLLDDFSRDGEWLFTSYAQVTSGIALRALETFSEVELDYGLIRPDVRRARPHEDAPPPLAQRARRLYERLVTRAERDVARWSGRGEA